MGSIKRIDFIGAAGVGKSTLYHELLKNRGRNDQWMTPKEVEIIIAKSELKKYPPSMNRWVRSRILNIQLFRKLHHLVSETILNNNAYKNLSLWEDREELEAINTLIAANASIPFPPFVKLRRLKRLFEFSYQIALFQKLAPDNTTVVFDDSLTNEITFLGPWSSDSTSNNLYTFYNGLGGLSAVVFLDADDYLVVERLRRRMASWVNTAHYGMTTLQVTADTKRRLNSARQLAGMLEERGIPVFRVNAGDPVAKQVRMVGEALKQYT